MSILIDQSLDEFRFFTLSRPFDHDVYRLKQVHGDKVIPVAKDIDSHCEGDALTSNLKLEKPLCILTADCLPIAVIGLRGVALVHAGWRGVQNNITLSSLIEEIIPQKIYIGPHIKSCCFEVSEDFQTHFNNSPHFLRRDGKLYFDLEAEMRDRISHHFQGVEISSSGQCTCCNEKFHSFRRNQTKERNWNLLVRKDSAMIKHILNEEIV